MKYLFKCICIILCAHNALAHNNERIDTQMQESARQLIKNIFDDNNTHVQKNSNAELKSIKNSQAPRATVVSCSDSRVQSSAIDDTSINDLFYIRNIGNQISTSKGSVIYGVQYLNTPVLLIIGHVDCGAINTTLADYSNKPASIKRELMSFDLPVNISPQDGVISNIHNQVTVGLDLFKDRVKSNKLVVIGAVYDFQNKYKKGYNRLIIVNVNGEQDPEKIANSSYLEGINRAQIGLK